MERKNISDILSVSGQISAIDVAQLKSEGVQSIICNRPDGEDEGQPESEEIKKIAEQNDLTFYFMPVRSGQVTSPQGEKFADILKDAPKPIHAYCRSGMRCTILWAITQLNAGVDKESILEQANKAGYDLTKIF